MCWNLDLYKVYSLSSNGQLCVWECDTDLDGLIPWENEEPVEEVKEKEPDAEEDNENSSQNVEPELESKILYKRLGK